MKIVVTSDLHYNIARSRKPTERIAEEICGLSADALIILGDVGGREPHIVSDCLHLFDRFQGRKFFVAGNHELWVPPGEHSLTRLEETLPELCRQAGFHPLDMEPAPLDGVGLVGSIGWYDYSFRPHWLEVPLRFYRAKMAPGAAARVKELEHLFAEQEDIPEASMRYGVRWMDGKHVSLGMSDEEFCERLAKQLDQHLRQEAARSRKIVVAMHHLPFEEVVPRTTHPSWAFAGAYMGSERFGEVILEHPKVQYAFCGHSHRGMGIRKKHVTCLNVGCTYQEKRYDIIEV
jgi:Icc-related predicted phosphoesterase